MARPFNKVWFELEVNPFQHQIKPENIMASFDLVKGTVTNFVFKLADWGTAGGNRAFYGGTPGYASKLMFKPVYKDFFSIGRLALDLFVDKTGVVEDIYEFIEKYYFHTIDFNFRVTPNFFLFFHSSFTQHSLKHVFEVLAGSEMSRLMSVYWSLILSTLAYLTGFSKTIACVQKQIFIGNFLFFLFTTSQRPF